MGRAAYEYTVDTTFHRQVHGTDIVIRDILCGGSIQQTLFPVHIRLLHGLVVARADATDPFAFSPEFVVNPTVIQRTAAPLFVDYLHLVEHHIGSIGFCAKGILYGRKLQVIRFAGSLYLITAAI